MTDRANSLHSSQGETNENGNGTGAPMNQINSNSSFRRLSMLDTFGFRGKGDEECDMCEAALGLADPEASQEEALEAFNAFVQREGVEAMTSSVGGTALPYRSLLGIMSFLAWSTLDQTTASIAIGHYSTKDVIVKVVESGTASFILIPLAVALASNLASRFPDLSFRFSVVLCAMIGCLVVFLVVAIMEGMNLLSDFVREKDTVGGKGRLQYMWIFFIIDMVGIVWLCRIQSTRAQSCWKSNPEVSSFTSSQTIGGDAAVDGEGGEDIVESSTIGSSSLSVRNMPTGPTSGDEEIRGPATIEEDSTFNPTVVGAPNMLSVDVEV